MDGIDDVDAPKVDDEAYDMVEKGYARIGCKVQVEGVNDDP